MPALLRLALFMLVAMPVVRSAQDEGSRVNVLDSTASIELPAGWEYVKKADDHLVGPKGAAFIHIAYFEASPDDRSSRVDREFAAQFVQNNLKLAKAEVLGSGRVFGHGVEKMGSTEHHQWNIATVVDARHLGVLLIGMETGSDHAKIVSTVDRLARSVQFLPHKKNA